MGQQSKIRTLRQVDDPVQLTSSYRLNAIDRALIDEEIRATQQHVVQSLISGLVATWAILDSGSSPVTPGCVVASASSALGTVKLASTLTVLGQAGQGAGIVLASASPGAPVWIAVAGIILQSAGITGLAVGSPGPVKIDGGTILVGGSGRLVQVASFAAADYPAGYVDNAGNFTIGFLQTGIAGASGGGGSAGVTWLLGTDAAYQPTAARGRQIVVIPTLTANHTWKFPAAPQDGDQIELYDRTGVMATSGFVLSVQGNAGTEHVFAEGADKGTLYPIPNALLGNGSIVFTYRNTSTTWEMS